jgi:O-antigen ligase
MRHWIAAARGAGPQALIGGVALLGHILALSLLPGGDFVPEPTMFAIATIALCLAAIVGLRRETAFSFWFDLPCLGYAAAVALSAYLAPAGGYAYAWRDALWFSALAMASWRVALDSRVRAQALAAIVVFLAILLSGVLSARSNPDPNGRFLLYPAVIHWGAYPEIGMLAGIAGGATLAIALAARIWRLRAAAAVLTALFGLVTVLVLSRSGILAFAVVVAWLILAAAIKWRERWILLALVAACAGGAYAARYVDTSRFERSYLQGQASYAVSERAMHWDVARSLVRDHPWTGVGPGRFTSEFPKYERRIGPQSHAHNMLLNVAAETGIVALVPFVWIWARVLLGTLFARSRGAAAVVAFAAHGMVMAFFIRNMTDHFLTNVHSSLRTSLFVAILLGLAEASIRDARLARRAANARPALPPTAV